jgi:hypothetical protein
MTDRLPTMEQAVDIVSQQILKSSQVAQLRYMRQTQGEAFAQQVKAKVVANGKAAKK